MHLTRLWRAVLMAVVVIGMWGALLFALAMAGTLAAAQWNANAQTTPANVTAHVVAHVNDVYIGRAYLNYTAGDANTQPYVYIAHLDPQPTQLAAEHVLDQWYPLNSSVLVLYNPQRPRDARLSLMDMLPLYMSVTVAALVTIVAFLSFLGYESYRCHYVSPMKTREPV